MKFSSKKSIKKNFNLLLQVLDKSSRNRRTTILTARNNPVPIRNFFKEELKKFNQEDLFYEVEIPLIKEII